MPPLAAAVAMLEDGAAERVYELGGEPAFRMQELADEIARQSHREITYQNLPANPRPAPGQQFVVGYDRGYGYGSYYYYQAEGYYQTERYVYYWNRDGREIREPVTLQLYTGSIAVVGRQSAHALYDERFVTFGEDDVYDQADAGGFIRLYGLPLRVAALRDREAGVAEVGAD